MGGMMRADWVLKTAEACIPAGSGAGAPGRRLRALLASAEGPGAAARHRLVALGAEVEAHAQLYDALAVLADDPRAAQVLVVDCDGFGGVGPVALAIGRVQGLDAGVPVVLITRRCPEQEFPSRRRGPVVLRAPVSALALRLALELVLNRLPVPCHGFAPILPPT